VKPEEVEPEQADIIEQAIAALNVQVEEATAQADRSESQAIRSDERAEDSEAWAVGTRKGRYVVPGDETYNNNSKYYANLAAQGAQEAGYVWFDVHDDDGIMYVYITENLDEDVEFTVDENKGILEVNYK
jgi:hypothetical protein